MSITIRPCTIHDIEQLAIMNKQLIEDEKSDNPMNIDELKERMLNFLSTDYHAYFFMIEEDIIGYSLIRDTEEPCYLRQFFINRDYRKKHYGTQAFHSLLEYLTLDDIELEVLPWNERGLKFWESCGFLETSRCLRYRNYRK